MEVSNAMAEKYMERLISQMLLPSPVIPLFAIFVIRFFQFLPERKKRNLYAIAAIVLIELVLYTAWYIAFFSALFAGICLVVWLLLGIGRKGYLKQQFALFFRTVRYDLLIYAITGSNTITTVLSILLGILVYFVLAVNLKVINHTDMENLPGGKYLAWLKF